MLTLILKWLSFLNRDKIYTGTAYTFAKTFFYCRWNKYLHQLKMYFMSDYKTGLSDMHRDMLIYLLLTALLAVQCHVSDKKC